ncbi:DUF4251 domain-containing protein [Parabacteroides bouchesdurhonensis]|uniref:DUF4251 domain-containing protein n=1 Tax=Parabacteroides bouchesdurhonensis TaxID=1936995 RepID=UPI000E5365F0|nr:DUF4251 domain-containing protein [Parabacteroides bouchesdurhonensis]RHJ95298.1 DUF4251 domain-containing protein [Bacteroides sp. AM07-16]
MKRIVSYIVVLAVSMCGMTQIKAQKAVTKEAKKVEREVKKQERLAQDAIQDAEQFNQAVQALNNQSFVLEANSIQPMNGQVFYVNSGTNFVSLNNGQAMVQIASTFNPNPGPNGLGGITVQGMASNIQTKQDKEGNMYLSMSVMGTFISATVNLVLYNDSNRASVTIDPNFSGRNLTMTGTLVPYSDSNIFQGTTY